jgi:hypothetical protein
MGKFFAARQKSSYPLSNGDWSPGQPERGISIGQTKFSMIAVCGLFDQFADELPQHVFDKLRSYMDPVSMAI